MAMIFPTVLLMIILIIFLNIKSSIKLKRCIIIKNFPYFWLLVYDKRTVEITSVHIYSFYQNSLA